MSGAVRCKRIYEPADPGDGVRVLVERLWPRGIRKADAAIADWMKTVAPSTELRRWFGHDPVRRQGFERRYREELDAKPDAVEALLRLAREQDLTLVYAARDAAGNSATVLRDYLLERLAQAG